MLTEALKNITLRFISLYLYLKEFILNCALPLEQLCDHIKQSQYLLLSLILIIKTTIMASIGLTVYMEAVDEGEDEATVYIEAVEVAYTEEINDIEETREQDFNRRDIMSIINQAVSLLSILLKSKRRHIRSSINILYIY